MRIIRFALLYVALLARINKGEALDTDNFDLDTSFSFQNAALKAINRARWIHQVSPLALDAKLAESASIWALSVHGETEKHGHLWARFAHPEPEGEAVFVTPKGKSLKDKQLITEAVTKWYCEVNNFDFGRNMFHNFTAQFTQLVWRNTRRVGISKVTNRVTGDVVIVARFAPPGNWRYLRSFKANVFAPISFDLIDECPQPENSKENEPEKPEEYIRQPTDSNVFFSSEEARETTFEPAIVPIKHEKSPGDKWIPPTTVETTTTTTTERHTTTTTVATTSTSTTTRKPIMSTATVKATIRTTTMAPTTTSKATRRSTRRTGKPTIRYKDIKNALIEDSVE